MPRLLIVSCLLAALLVQGCAGVQQSMVAARGVSEPVDVREPPATAPTSDNERIDLWREPATDDNLITGPEDLVRSVTQPDDPSLREWLSDHPLVKAGVAVGIMALAAGITLTTTLVLDKQTNKKKR
jgi:hypothetical protein